MWLAHLLRNQSFPYALPSCGTLYCEQCRLGLLAGCRPDYTQEGGAAGHVENPKEPERVVRWLDQFGPGTFVDYGCGEGELLTEAQSRGWQAVGVEFSEDVARRTRQQTDLPVCSQRQEIEALPPADLLHLGDVIDLTSIDEQMPES